MSNAVRAVVLGAGYAGQGHTQALRYAGADVVGLASRTEAVGRKVAAELGIARYGSDWRQLLDELRPDVVAIGTPGGTHREMVGNALERGCHVFADKPLATTAADSRTLYELAARQRVKTAYAASFCYQPQALFVRDLIRAGTIGEVYEVECLSHFHWPPLMPFGWPHRLDQGGGRLNNNFPHKLAIVQRILGGELLACMGESRNDLKRVPIAGAVHDFRDFAKQALTPDQAAQLEWAAVDSDWSYTALVRIGDPARGLNDAVSATFRHSALRAALAGDSIAFYGEKGTLHVEGCYMQGAVLLKAGGPTWEELAVPLDIIDALPPDSDNTQRNWNQLAREFIADIEGRAHEPYLTFRDGWLYQAVIDAVRSNCCWQPLPAAE